MKKQLVRAAAATVLGISLTTGFAAADINTTGPSSTNRANTSVSSNQDHNNNNTVRATANSNQDARTGTANSTNSTFGGGASTGAADNFRATDASVSIRNTSSSSTAPVVAPANNSDISITGPNSTNETNYNANYNTVVRNNNDVAVNSTTNQTARSGDANTSNNTNGGSASTGSASNTSSEVYTFEVSN